LTKEDNITLDYYNLSNDGQIGYMHLITTLLKNLHVINEASSENFQKRFDSFSNYISSKKKYIGNKYLIPIVKNILERSNDYLTKNAPNLIEKVKNSGLKLNSNNIWEEIQSHISKSEIYSNENFQSFIRLVVKTYSAKDDLKEKSKTENDPKQETNKVSQSDQLKNKSNLKKFIDLIDLVEVVKQGIYEVSVLCISAIKFNELINTIKDKNGKFLSEVRAWMTRLEANNQEMRSILNSLLNSQDESPDEIRNKLQTLKDNIDNSEYYTNKILSILETFTKQAENSHKELKSQRNANILSIASFGLNICMSYFLGNNIKVSTSTKIDSVFNATSALLSHYGIEKFENLIKSLKKSKDLLIRKRVHYNELSDILDQIIEDFNRTNQLNRSKIRRMSEMIDKFSFTFDELYNELNKNN